jgi:hypothetical protein
MSNVEDGKTETGGHCRRSWLLALAIPIVPPWHQKTCTICMVLAILAVVSAKPFRPSLCPEDCPRNFWKILPRFSPVAGRWVEKAAAPSVPFCQVTATGVRGETLEPSATENAAPAPVWGSCRVRLRGHRPGAKSYDRSDIPPGIWPRRLGGLPWEHYRKRMYSACMVKLVLLHK